MEFLINKPPAPCTSIKARAFQQSLKARQGFTRLTIGGLMLLLITAFPVQRLRGQTQTLVSLEFQVKAAFLLNFTKFVEWPQEAFPEANSPITICLLGDDPFGRVLDQLLAGEVVNERALTVRRISDVPRARTCQILFINRREQDVPQLLRTLGGGVLTVSESDEFISDGGMINFVIDDRRVRFDINQTAAEAASLQLSSQLLKVARSVR